MWPWAAFGQAAPANSTLAPLALPSLVGSADAPSSGGPVAIPPAKLDLEKLPDPFAALRNTPSFEARPPAQLEAILRSYVGKWRGQTAMRVVGLRRLISFPIEMDCAMEDKDGRKVLVSTTRYTFGGRAIVETQRMWVQDGRIVSEVTGGSTPRRFVVRSQGDSLVWALAEPGRSPVDYNHVETVRLTADGGRLLMQGFEVTPSARGMAMLCESTELKLAK